MQYEELIDKYRRGTLTEAELEILREWINNADADEIIRALEIKSTADVTEPDDESIERLRSMVYSRIRQEQPDFEPEFSTSHGMGFWKKYAIAATLLLPLLLVGMYMWLGRESEPQYMTVTTSGNNRTRVLLPDGSVAVVKGESSLEFPLTFSGNERRVVLNGQVSFSIVKDPEHPFCVESPYIDVRVLGTRFSMLARRNLDYSEVFLDSGKVEVTSLVTKDTKVLTPGQTVTVDNASGAMEVRPAQLSLTVDWFNDEMMYRRVSPDTLIRSIESNYGIRLSADVASRITSRFSGTLPSNDLATTMEVLSSVYDFDMPYTYQDDSITKRFCPRVH